MGQCCVKTETFEGVSEETRDKQVAAELNTAKASMGKEVKLLLLG